MLEINAPDGSAPACRATSGYIDVDRDEDPRRYIRRLDRVGSSAFWRCMKSEALDALALQPGDAALDVGCGAGNDVLEMAERVGPLGRAVGVDLSAAMVAEARARATSAGCAAEFVQASAARLPFPDRSFDACRVERVLQHLDAPELALREMVRVAAPGARLVVIEPDYSSLWIDGADLEVTARMLAFRRSHFRSPEIGRRAARILRTLGVTALEVIPAVFSTASHYGQEEFLREKYAAPALAAGVVSSVEAGGWLRELAQAGEAGAYRHAVAVYRVRGVVG